MADTRHTKTLIIGSGPAGYTAGVYAASAMLEPILVQGIEPGGQLTTTTEVENWPGDTEVQGPDLMVRMEAHAKAMGCEIVGDIITHLDTDSRPFKATGDSGTVYTADSVIMATGAHERPLVYSHNDVPGNLLAGAVTTYLTRYGVAAGDKLVLSVNNDHAYRAALAWAAAGREVVAIADARPARRFRRRSARGGMERKRGQQLARAPPRVRRLDGARDRAEA